MESQWLVALIGALLAGVVIGIPARSPEITKKRLVGTWALSALLTTGASFGRLWSAQDLSLTACMEAAIVGLVVRLALAVMQHEANRFVSVLGLVAAALLIAMPQAPRLEALLAGRETREKVVSEVVEQGENPRILTISFDDGTSVWVGKNEIPAVRRTLPGDELIVSATSGGRATSIDNKTLRREVENTEAP